MSDWTSERLIMLEKLWAHGQTASVVAQTLNEQTGSKFTRSAICGKVNRLGLSLHPVLKQPKKKREGLAPRRYRSREIIPNKYRNRDFRAAAAGLDQENTALQNCPSPPLAPPKPIKPFKIREINDGFVADRCTYDDSCTEKPVRGRFFCEPHCMLVYRPATAPKVPDPMRPFPRHPLPRQPTRR